MSNLSSAGTRRWLLSFLATRSGRRLLRAALTAALAINLAAPVWAEGGTQGNLPSQGRGGELKRGGYSILRIPYLERENTQYAIRNTPPIENPKSKIQNPYTTPAVQNALRQLGLEGLDGVENMPVGGQFQVNSYTTNGQWLADVAVDSDGAFVVVWTSNGSSSGDTSGYSIQGQRYDSAGVAQGSQFQVNNYTTGNQDFPKVAMDNEGDFVVIWQSEGSSGSDTDYYSIQGRRYNSAGTAQGGQFQVNNYTTFEQRYPDVAMDGDGDFVVVWWSYGSDGGDNSPGSIQGRRYNSAGSAQGSQFQVNSYTTGSQWTPAVALDDDGDFVVVWVSDGSFGNDEDETSIQGQRYNSAGVAQGSQFQVNSYTIVYQAYPAVAMDSDGDFVVVWANSGTFGYGYYYDIEGQRYNSIGTPQGSEFRVTNFSSDISHTPDVAMDEDGDFVVVWQSNYSFLGDISGGINGKRYNSIGAVQSNQFPVNNYTTDSQNHPAVALDNDGDFVVVWQSLGSDSGAPVDSSDYSIQAKRYPALPPPPPAGQFQVNSYTDGDQFRPAVAMDNDGDFVVVWTSYGSGGSDGDGTSIQGQRYNAAGTVQGSQFQVNSYTTGSQLKPVVVMDSDGDFVVVWRSNGSVGNDNSGLSIQGQRYNNAGVPQGNQFQVNTITAGHQDYAAVAMDSSGDFIIVWQNPRIQGQRYNSAGVPQGSQFQVNSYTTYGEARPAVAMDSDGDFVVVWESGGSVGNDNSVTSVQGQRFNSAGTAQGSQFQVNSYTTHYQKYPAVAMDDDGDFVVVWVSNGSNGSDTHFGSIQAQRYNSAGTSQGGQFQVNIYTTGSQQLPAIAMDHDGDFIITWQSVGSNSSDRSSLSVQSRLFGRNGLPLLDEFQANVYTTGFQGHATVATDIDGDFVIAWSSYGSVGTDVDRTSIQAARFDLGQLDFQVNVYTTGDQRSPAVAIDSDGDFVIVWQSNGSDEGDSSLNSIQARRYDSRGVALGDQFQVNTCGIL